MSLPGRETIYGNDLHQELVAVAGGPAIVGLEDQPSVGGGEGGPLIPVGFEVVAVGIGGAAVNQREHGQMLCFEFSRRINQHAFDGGAVVGLPLVGLALRKFAFGEQFVEGGDGRGPDRVCRDHRQVNFAGLARERSKRMPRGASAVALENLRKCLATR